MNDNLKSSAHKSLLNQLLDLAYEIEQSSKPQVNQNLFVKFLEVYERLILKTEFQNLIRLKPHLHPEMSVQQFSNFIIPIEREFNRQVADDQFMIQSQDHYERAIADTSAGADAGGGAIANTNAKSTTKLPVVLMLENLRSAFNVGSIFRTADALQVEEISLVGYTPNPDSTALKKTSLGSANYVHSNSFLKISEAIQHYKNKNYKIIAVETALNSKSIYDFNFPELKPCVFIFGNERFGLEATTLAQCDFVLSLPTFGFKNSINVSNAVAIVGYEFLRQCR